MLSTYLEDLRRNVARGTTLRVKSMVRIRTRNMLCETKVGNLDVSVVSLACQQQILWLEVTVHNTPFVEECHLPERVGAIRGAGSGGNVLSRSAGPWLRTTI